MVDSAVPKWLLWLLTAPGRSVRVLRAFFPILAKPDDAFAGEFLSPHEYRLYLGMDSRDRHHACEVARRVLERAPRASQALISAALLHDIGKSTVPYHPLHRIAVGFYLPKGLPAEPRLRGWPGVWQLGLHHDRYGAEMIRAAGGSKRVAEIVARHHRPEGDPEAQLLKEIDEHF